jgi:hypothetical protein
MSEVLRNIPEEAVSKANKSSQLRKIRTQQFIARWGFRAAYLAGLYEVKDTIYSEFLNMITLNIHDIRTFTITELTGLALISSRVVGQHFEKQKYAIRTNSINRKLHEEFLGYNSILLPEGHIE